MECAYGVGGWRLIPVSAIILLVIMFEIALGALTL
jgi:hypothetical protein